jgi:hypothetical protein
MKRDPLCPGEPVWNFYSVEVVQRIGYDSFTPDNGVLIAKNKDREGNTCGYNCFTWVIDAHPQDIDQRDFVKPDGTRVMRTVADYRQLNDALFKAGLRSGSAFEWTDEPNRLHFYVVDLHRNATGILSYTVAVRSLDGAGPHERGVAARAPESFSVSGSPGVLEVSVTNTGKRAPLDPGLHPADASASLSSDVYRLSVEVDGEGWSAHLRNALVAIEAGKSAGVPVYVARASGAKPGRVVVTAVSESDPSKQAGAATTVR